MKFGFYLKHDDLVDLINEYDIHTPGNNKGLVVLLKVTKSSGDLQTEIRFKGVEGPLSNTGEIPDRTSAKIPCPYPPPCRTDASGNLIIDFDDPDADCYRQ